MAWRTADRFEDVEERHQAQTPGPEWVEASDEPGLWLLPIYRKDGFCGLAGQP